MLRINEKIIRAYFEMNNFLVKINRDYNISENDHEKDEMGLIIVNLNPNN